MDSVLVHKGARQILLIYVMYIIYLYMYHDNITMLSSWNEYVDRYGHGQILVKIGIWYKPWIGTDWGRSGGMRRN